jgi:hypothetical protein
MRRHKEYSFICGQDSLPIPSENEVTPPEREQLHQVVDLS